MSTTDDGIWAARRAPGLDEFHRIATGAFEDLPAAFRAVCGDVFVHVSEMATDEVLDDLGIEDPLELTGLYEGATVFDADAGGDAFGAHVHLYRLPVLYEWCERGDVTLSDLIRHVLVHEIGHHFGLSDEDMHRIEAMADAD